VQHLVRGARGVAALDLLVRPRLTAVRAGRLRLAVASITDNGEIAARCGGLSWAVNNWLMPPYEMPIIPTLWPRTHG
jgi:hypothetical protein